MVLLIEYAHLETKGQKQEEFDSMTLKIKPRHKTNPQKTHIIFYIFYIPGVQTMPLAQSTITDLLPRDGHVISDVGEDSGLDEVALVAMATTPSLHLGAFCLALVDQAQDLVELLAVNLKEDRDISVHNKTSLSINTCPLLIKPRILLNCLPSM